jgi:predicted nucleic acid-binding protein
MLVGPEAIVIDTSLVVDALWPAQRHHQECAAFLARMAEINSVLVFSRLLEVELAETAFRLALKERYGNKGWKQARHDRRARERANRLMQRVLGAWEELLSGVRSASVSLDDVAEQVPTLMRQFGLASYDAAHAATAFHLGVSEFATLDAGFAAVPASRLTLYVNESRVAHCRRIRGRLRPGA